MATISFKLRGKGERANLCFRLREGKDIDVLHTSDIEVDVLKWDKKKHTLKGTNTIGKAELEKKIADRKNVIYQVFESLDKERINNSLFNLEIDKVLHPENYKSKVEIGTLFEFVDYFIKEAPKRKHKITKRLLTPNNIQQYKATEKHLRAFAESIGRKDFSFELFEDETTKAMKNEIDQSFYDGFVEYLQNEIPDIDKQGKPKKDKEGNPILLKEAFTANSVGKHIRILKLMLNEATIQGFNQSSYYNSFHVLTEDTDTVYLNENELSKLKEADFSKKPYLDRVRDWFLLLAWTGVRFSDLEKVGKTDIQDGFISFRQQKTNEKVTIPLHPVVLEVLEKYDYSLPEPISNQRFNEYIKEVAKIAKIDTNESITVTKGGELITEHLPKWQLVSSHTGRRSFCTNMYKRGLPTLMIMSISGHKTEKSFLKYIKVRQKEHAEMMKKAWKEMYK